ncbi:MAG: hypothetical protein H7242_14530 [Microbacteriaceae bacterium]|nr:hypothetical protein [Burkholderiaceae bacterium]
MLLRSAIHHHLHRVRGQITVLAASTPGLPALPRPLADTGYALTLADGRLLCGASAQPEGRGTAADHDEGLRPADHAHNLATLARLTGWAAGLGTAPLAGRVAWRQQSDDRLPLLGPVPALWAEGLIGQGQEHRPGHGPTPPPAVAAPRPVQARQVPRQAGLYVFTALGSRGISHAALGGEVLAAWISGDPVPAPASLLDALDPARFIARTARRPS